MWSESIKLMPSVMGNTYNQYNAYVCCIYCYAIPYNKLKSSVVMVKHVVLLQSVKCVS